MSKCQKALTAHAGKIKKTNSIISFVSNNEFTAEQKCGLTIIGQICFCEPSIKTQYVEESFKCQKIEHTINEGNNEERCLRCSGQRTRKQCTEQRRKPIDLTVMDHMHFLYKGYASYQNAVTEAIERN